MGYSTRYEIEVRNSTTKYDIEVMQKAGTDEGIISEMLGYDPFSESCKWYNHEIDMKTLSKEFSGVLFVLSGEGEEMPDLWIKYFRSGKMQRCEAIITYEPFDENKMI